MLHVFVEIVVFLILIWKLLIDSIQEFCQISSILEKPKKKAISNPSSHT